MLSKIKLRGDYLRNQALFRPLNLPRDPSLRTPPCLPARTKVRAPTMRAAAVLIALLGLLHASAAHAITCQDSAFVDTIADSAWVNLDVLPTAGTGGVRDALRVAQAQHPGRPVRIRLAPGHYADTLGGEIYAQRLQRSAEAPLWLVASDPRPDATVLGHGINLLGVSYVAIEGLTIGPARVGAWDGQRHADPQPLQAAAGLHVAGAALDARRSALLPGGGLDTTVYGRYEPSHHVLVRRVTVQNLFNRDERDGESSESLDMDGMTFNQVQDLWVLDSRVSQTTRHGIDLVGVHRAAICRTLVSRSGGGLGIEAKGGSVDVLYDSNLFHKVRRVELGGEDTDATYYFSADGRWDYEALRTVARNNLIVDPREAALEFSGCQDCMALGNSVWFTADYRPPSDGGNVYGGDAIRVHDSRVLGADDGAGSDCQFWDEAAQDYVTVDPCWGVGARHPAPVNRVLRSERPTVLNNLFFSDRPLFGSGGGSTVPCPLNVVGGDAVLALDGNFWWNGGQGLPLEGCSTLAEGGRSQLPRAGSTASVIASGRIDATSLSSLSTSIISGLLPAANSPLRGMAMPWPSQSPVDALGAPRDGTAGALVGTLSDADRLFNWAQFAYPQLFAPAAGSSVIAGYYARHYPGTQSYLGTTGGHLYVVSPALGGQVMDLGPLADWLPLALSAGY